MKKFVLSVLVCLLLATTSANAAILKDNEGFSYIINYNYLMFDGGSHACTVYDLSSTHILADNNQRFEFNVIELLIGYHGEEIMGKRISNIREDYDTGKIYRDGQLLDNKRFWHGKTQREIYYKIKSAALSR